MGIHEDHLHGRRLMTAVLTLTSLGFFMIGYDNGLFGGFVEGESFKSTFGNPKPEIVGLIVSIYEIGCFIGSVMTAFVGDRLGRRKTMMVGVVLMMVGAVIQGTAYTLAHMLVGRIVCGMGMGFINSTGPVLQAEFSPKTVRGLFVCVQISTLNFGIMLVYWINYALVHVKTPWAWRIPVLLQLIFLLAMLYLCFIIPESPRWLVSHGYSEEAFDVLSRLKGDALNEQHMRRLCRDIISAVHIQSSKGAPAWKDLFKRDALHSRRRFLIACGIQAMQQLGGINAIIFYSTTIFKLSLGFDGVQAALLAGFLQTWFFLASFIPWRFIDRVGRRPLLLSMIFVMACCFTAQTPLASQISNQTKAAYASGIVATIVLFIYQGAFTIGFQATVWVYPSEILPIHLRQRGSAISTASNWICNYMVVQVAPIALDRITWRTYIIYAVLNFAFLPIIYFFFPETTGLELEDVDTLFETDPSGRNNSVQMSLQARRRHGRLRLHEGSDYEDSTFPSPSTSTENEIGQFPRGHTPRPEKQRPHRCCSCHKKDPPPMPAALTTTQTTTNSSNAPTAVASTAPRHSKPRANEWPTDAWTWFSDNDSTMSPPRTESVANSRVFDDLTKEQQQEKDVDFPACVAFNATPTLPLPKAKRRSTGSGTGTAAPASGGGGGGGGLQSDGRWMDERGVHGRQREWMSSGRTSPMVEHVEDGGSIGRAPSPSLPDVPERRELTLSPALSSLPTALPRTMAEAAAEEGDEVIATEEGVAREQIEQWEREAERQRSWDWPLPRPSRRHER